MNRNPSHRPMESTGTPPKMKQKPFSMDASRASLMLAGFLLATSSFAHASGTEVNLGDFADPTNPRGYSFSTGDRIDEGLNYVVGIGDLNHDGHGDFAYPRTLQGPADPPEYYVRFGRPDGAPDNDGDTLNGFTITLADELVDYWTWTEIRSIGDFDGDGHSDIAISLTYLRDIGNDYISTGGVLVLYGPFSGDVHIDSDFFFGESAHPGGFILGYDLNGNSNFMGQALTGVGDFNGDGYDDFAIGASYADPKSVYLILGNEGRINGNVRPADLLEEERLLIFENPFPPQTKESSGFGTRLFPIGDINGDGFADFAISDAYFIGDEYLASHVHIVFGGPFFREEAPMKNAGAQAATPSDPAKQENGPEFLTLFYPFEDGFSMAGRAVAGIGDFNGDGYTDFAVGDPGYGDDAGVVIIHFGGPQWGGGELSFSDIPTSETIRITNWEYSEFGDQNNFGGRLSPAGDFTGNGYDDLLAGHGAAPWVSTPAYLRAYLIEGGPDASNFDISAIDMGTRSGKIFRAPDGEHSPGIAMALLDDIDEDFKPEILLVTEISDASASEPRERAYILFSDDPEPVPLITDLYADSTTITVEHTGVTIPKGVLNSIGVWSREINPNMGSWKFYGLGGYMEGETVLEVPWNPEPDSVHEIAARLRDGNGWSGDFHYYQFGDPSEPAAPQGLTISYDQDNGEVIAWFDIPGTAPSGIAFWNREVSDTTGDVRQPTEPMSSWVYHGITVIPAGVSSHAIPFEHNGKPYQVSVGIQKVGEPGFSEVKDHIVAPPGMLVTPRLVNVFSNPAFGDTMRAIFDPPGNLPNAEIAFESRRIMPFLITPMALGSWEVHGYAQYPAGPESEPLPHIPGVGTSLRSVWSSEPLPDPDTDYYEHRARLLIYDEETEAVFQAGAEVLANNPFDFNVEIAQSYADFNFRYLPLSPGDMFGSRAVSIGDINGDGVDDMAVFMPGSTHYPFHPTRPYEISNATVWLFLMNADGTIRDLAEKSLLYSIGNYDAPRDLGWYFEPTLLAGDTNNNGRNELIVVNPNMIGGTREYENNELNFESDPRGGFSIINFDPAFPDVQTRIIRPDGTHPYMPFPVDANWLGRSAALLGSYPNMAGGSFLLALTAFDGFYDDILYIINVESNNPPFEFSSGDLDLDFGPHLLAAGDLTNNGLQDLLIVSSNEDVYQHFAGFHILIFDEDGEPERAMQIVNEDTSFPLNITGVVSVALEDLTGNGVADLILGRDDGSPLVIVEMNADGTHGDIVTISTTQLNGAGIPLQSPYHIAVSVEHGPDENNIATLVLGNRRGTTSQVGHGDKGEVFRIHYRHGTSGFLPGSHFNNTTPNFRSRFLDETPTPRWEFGQALAINGDPDVNGNVQLLIGAPGYYNVGAVFNATVNPDGIILSARRYAPGHPSLPLEIFEPGARFGEALSHLNEDADAGTRLFLAGAPDNSGFVDDFPGQKDIFIYDRLPKRGSAHLLGVVNNGELLSHREIDDLNSYLPYMLLDNSQFGSSFGVMTDVTETKVHEELVSESLGIKSGSPDKSGIHFVYIGAPGHDADTGAVVLVAMTNSGDIVFVDFFDVFNPLGDYTYPFGGRLGESISVQRPYLNDFGFLPDLFVGTPGSNSWQHLKLNSSGFPELSLTREASVLQESFSPPAKNWGVGKSFLRLPGSAPHYLVGAPLMSDFPPEASGGQQYGGLFIVFGESDGQPRYTAKMSPGSGKIQAFSGRFGQSMAMISTNDGLTVNGSVLAVGIPGAVNGRVTLYRITTNYDAAF